MSYLPARAAHNPDDRLRDLERQAAHDPAAAARLQREQARRRPPEPCQWSRRGMHDEAQWVDACDDPVAGLDPFSGTPLCDFHLAPLRREWAALGRRDLWFGRVRAGDRMKPPRLNPGDDRLRALERAALQGDPAAAAALEQERRRRGLPVDERRRYIADLTAQAAEENALLGQGAYAFRDRANVAKALRAVLKAEKITGVTITTPRYSMANHLEISGTDVEATGVGNHTWKVIHSRTYVDLLRLFFGEEVASHYERQPWAHQRGVQDLSLYVNNRDDRSDVMSDYHHPAGPSLPWWAADVYMRALAVAAAKSKPRAVATAARRGRLSCSACGRGVTALYRAGESDVCRRCYGR